jgi:hypothetical protein
MFPDAGTRPPAAMCRAAESAIGSVVAGDGPVARYPFDTPARTGVLRAPTHS